MTVNLITRLNGVRAVIHREPAGIGPDAWLYVGELYSDAGWAWQRSLRVAPFNPRGLGLLLEELAAVAGDRAVRRMDRRSA